MNPIATTTPVMICRMNVLASMTLTAAVSAWGIYDIPITAAAPRRSATACFSLNDDISAFLTSIGTEPKTRPKKKNIDTMGKRSMTEVIGSAQRTIPSTEGTAKAARYSRLPFQSLKKELREAIRWS